MSDSQQTNSLVAARLVYSPLKKQINKTLWLLEVYADVL